ncbi:MAG: permease [Bacilli bacterium]|nr:permease [Bacilli bacterium]
MIKDIGVIFTSIFFESLPFLLLGAFISALIETFISNEKIVKFIPKNKILGSIVGVFLGFFLPACDCAVIPISKRLLKKKVPINVAISFMLASPIINPVVLLSTYYAFYSTNPEIFWYRLLFGILIALIIGIIMGIIYNKKNVIINSSDEECEHCSCEHHHEHDNKFMSIIRHTALDFFDVVKYLMFGALLASLVQVLLPRDLLLVFRDNNILSVLILMLFAYLISLCSTSDSFVGKSLLSSFGKSSIIAYLLLGPMIDIKNTIVLVGNFKKKFVTTLIALIFALVFVFSVLVVNAL